MALGHRSSYPPIHSQISSIKKIQILDGKLRERKGTKRNYLSSLFPSRGTETLSAPVTLILNLPIPGHKRIRARHNRSTFGVPPLGGSCGLFLRQFSARRLIHPPPLDGHLPPHQSINPLIHQSTALTSAPRLIDFALPRLHVATRVVADSSCGNVEKSPPVQDL